MKKSILYILMTVTLFSGKGQTKDTLFVEEFNTNQNKWWIPNQENLKGKLENGTFAIENSGGSGWCFSKPFNIEMSSDYSIELRIRQTAGQINHGFGIAWGWSSWDNYNTFCITTDGHFEVTQKRHKKTRTIKPYTKISYIKPMGEYNDLKIKQEGGTYKFYVNGNEVFQSDLSISPDGSEHGIMQWQFKNIEVDKFSLKGKIRTLNEVSDSKKGYVKENLGENVNSKYSEMCPLVSPGGKTLYHTKGNHPDNVGKENDQDIYFSQKSEDGSWSLYKNIGKTLNNTAPNFVVSVSADENSLITGNTYKADGTPKGAGISLSVRTVDGWSIPEDILIDNFENKDGWVEQCMSADQKILISAIESKFTYGARDLYVSFKLGEKHYSEPMNLGPVVNTNSWEMTPFLAADNKTLYYSSKGFKGYGGSDIYVTQRLDDTWKNWSTPKNLGPEVNTASDEMYFTLPASGEMAYLVSNLNSIGSSDIFKLKLSESARPDPVLLIKGKVLNKKTKQPLEAIIRYYELGTSKEIGSARSNPKNGDYSIILQYGKKYSFLAEKEGFFAVNDNLDLSKLTKYEEIQRDLLLVPIEVGSVITLNNIFFDFNKSDLKTESFSELDRVAELLNKNTAMEIEIGGHTDNVGADDYNIKLSQSRVESVMRYLTKIGINKSRIKAVGYGKSKPVASNDTDEGRAQNRRVEFTIIKN
jgi:outer membrane protein OmpA-like peptidoglycan-associated protein